MSQTYPQALSAMHVVTPGVKYVPGLASNAEQEAARRRLGLPLVGSCILFVGNDYKKKGLTTLIQALRKLDDESFVAVVGHSAQIPKFHEQMNAAGLAGRIFFLGSLHDVSDAYVAADCLAHPTLEDTFAMVVLEAMAHGLPVVVSQAQYCGISELLQHELNALILDDPRDAASLSNALRRVLNETSLRARLSDAAITFANKHQWSEMAMHQEAIYFSV
jgi:UDP-glucose:(heptosyl)LPS alpha-1,3-glucosyltransferase